MWKSWSKKIESCGNFQIWFVCFFSPYSSASPRRSPLMMFRITQCGQNFGDLIDDWIDVRKLLLKLKKHCTLLLFLLACKQRGHGPKSPMMKKLMNLPQKNVDTRYIFVNLDCSIPFRRDLCPNLWTYVRVKDMVDIISRTNSLAFVIKCLV